MTQVSLVRFKVAKEPYPLLILFYDLFCSTGSNIVRLHSSAIGLDLDSHWEKTEPDQSDRDKKKQIPIEAGSSTSSTKFIRIFIFQGMKAHEETEETWRPRWAWGVSFQLTWWGLGALGVEYVGGFLGDLGAPRRYLAPRATSSEARKNRHHGKGVRNKRKIIDRTLQTHNTKLQPDSDGLQVPIRYDCLCTGLLHVDLHDSRGVRSC